MKTLEQMDQNTPEWLQWRRDKIGASDAPTILEIDPYKTPYSLWEEKLGLRQQTSMNSSMQRGHDLEPLARQEAEKMTGLFFLPVVVEHDHLPYMVASLDGIDPSHKYILEIKCPSREKHEQARSGKIPEQYHAQMQHQLEVCNLEMGYYFSFNGSEGVVLKVYRDEAFIKKMLEKEKQFWACLQEFVPPSMNSRDYEWRTDLDWVTTAQEWISLNQDLEKKLERKEELRQKLISNSGNRNCMGGGVCVSKIISKGQVDYKSIPELKNVDLEKYRKKSVQSWRIVAK